MSVRDERYGEAMELALRLAQQAGAHGEVPIGAVLLNPQGRVVASGANARESTHDPTAHAEVVTLRQAGQALGSSHCDGCTLVVTVEPCTMCAGAIQLARVERVVFGAWEPKTGACGSVRDVLRDPRATHVVEVIGGFKAEACASLMREFFSALR